MQLLTYLSSYLPIACLLRLGFTLYAIYLAMLPLNDSLNPEL
ncbi:hypothetical protein T07_1424 [Trichinella nelsoni]|uniref:Uncharacterized protein n=1 Tax=Trichinella nelsoni TaxID=6336 RepID=A0A0V0RC29_9BILA|nr:hypothetical protein T07_1424 [Trichinella nelsoni]